MERRLGTLGKVFLARFVAHYESCAQDIKIIILEIKVLCCFREKKIVLPYSVFFFLRIVKS